MKLSKVMPIDYHCFSTDYWSRSLKSSYYITTSIESRIHVFTSLLLGLSLSLSLSTLFRGEITPLSSSYNISGLVPVCWLLFQCF